MVWQEICSFLKGSPEATNTPTGHLPNLRWGTRGHPTLRQRPGARCKTIPDYVVQGWALVLIDLDCYGCGTSDPGCGWCGCSKCGGSPQKAASPAHRLPYTFWHLERRCSCGRLAETPLTLVHLQWPAPQVFHRLYKQLGNHSLAIKACLRCGDFAGAAKSCEEAAKQESGAARARYLQEAILNHRKAKQKTPQVLLGLPIVRDGLLQVLCPQLLQENTNWRRTCPLRTTARQPKLLAEQGNPKAAISRLMLPLHMATKAEQKNVSVTWADKGPLSLLHTYCTSLYTSWAFQQMALVVDALPGHNHFEGDGYRAKGSCMQTDSRHAALQQYLRALALYR
ncbi:hypothetical protein ABBQ38_011357 [Trebouxia sp. C0009 RCD-2024]